MPMNVSSSFEAIAAKANDEPACLPGAQARRSLCQDGSYQAEYGMMQLIAESYDRQRNSARHVER